MYAVQRFNPAIGHLLYQCIVPNFDQIHVFDLPIK